MTKIAFICVHNSCRSQIAEALCRHLAGDVFECYSAGTETKPQINQDAVRLMKQLYNIDMEQTQFSKLIADIPPIDIVITMGCNVECPYLPCKQREDWGLEDPTGKSDEEFLKIIRQIEEHVLEIKNREHSFSDYKLSADILNALELLGYQNPTDIQKEVIPAILAGKNIVAKAPTGSGKTAAFAIPICEQVVWEENAPQALFLEPTRELAVQVSDETFYIARKKRLKIPAVFGGFPIDKQIQTLRQKSHIVVGTPGRVMDLIRRDSLKLDKISYLVIDEADQMLDMGFIDEVKEIIERLPSGVKISLFSATLRPEIEQIVEEYMEDSVQIMQEADEKQTLAITQKLYEVDSEHKYESLLNILMAENPDNCMIFCGTREMVNVLFQKLRRSRIFCGMLHGEMEQRERLKTVDAFRRGGFRFLIATDVAARGVDFENITHVINYDFPTGRETYVHRIGRTGRNGKTGTAVSLVGEEDRRMLKMVETYLEQELPVLACPAKEAAAEKEFWNKQRTKVEVKASKGAALHQGITRLSIGGGRKSKMRAGDIVGAICSMEGITVEDIGIIDIRDSMSYVEILNQKGDAVRQHLQERPIKGKVRKVK